MEPDHFLDEYDYLWFAGNCHNIEEFYIVNTKYRTWSVCSSHAETITWAQIQVKVNYFSCECPLKFVLVHFSLPQWWFQRWLGKNGKSDGGSVGNADYDDDADGIGVGVLTVMLAVMLWWCVLFKWLQCCHFSPLVCSRFLAFFPQHEEPLFELKYSPLQWAQFPLLSCSFPRRDRTHVSSHLFRAGAGAHSPNSGW